MKEMALGDLILQTVVESGSLRILYHGVLFQETCVLKNEAYRANAKHCATKSQEGCIAT